MTNETQITTQFEVGKIYDKMPACSNHSRAWTSGMLARSCGSATRSACDHDCILFDSPSSST